MSAYEADVTEPFQYQHLNGSMSVTISCRVGQAFDRIGEGLLIDRRIFGSICRESFFTLSR
jgi:hypothetical protein